MILEWEWNQVLDFIPFPIKHKSFIAEYKLSDKDLVAPDFSNKMVEVFKSITPLNDFLYRAMGG